MPCQVAPSSGQISKNILIPRSLDPMLFSFLVGCCSLLSSMSPGSTMESSLLFSSQLSSEFAPLLPPPLPLPFSFRKFFLCFIRRFWNQVFTYYIYVKTLLLFLATNMSILKLLEFQTNSKLMPIQLFPEWINNVEPQIVFRGRIIVGRKTRCELSDVDIVFPIRWKIGMKKGFLK